MKDAHKILFTSRFSWLSFRSSDLKVDKNESSWQKKNGTGHFFILNVVSGIPLHVILEITEHS